MARDQVAATASAVERATRPTYVEFRRRFLRPGRPVLITGAMDGWRAMQLWDFGHVGRVLGARPITPVVLENGNFRIDEREGVRVEQMDFATYWRLIDANDAPPYYLRLPLDGDDARLFDDYEVPEYAKRRIFLKRNLWVGTRGAASDLHFDMTHNLVGQVIGRRRVVLFPPEETANLYPYPSRINEHHSQVHVDVPDFERFPRFARARRLELELACGEMLFIPQGWWHHFTTLEPAIAVNFFWLTPRLAPALAYSRLLWRATGVRT